MSIPQPVVVFGATGAQGGSVVKALKAAGAAVIGITRNPDSDKAKALSESLGVELRKADLEDTASIPAAVAGAKSIFLVTDFWAMLGAGKTPEVARDEEVKQVAAVVAAAKDAGVEFIVYSGLEDVEALTGGALSVPHFDGKGRGEAIVAASGIPYAFVRLSAYTDNFLYFFPPRRGEDGKLAITIPQKDAPLDLFAVGDTGAAVTTILSSPATYAGKAFGLASDSITVSDFAAKLSAVLGEEVVYNAIPAAVFASFGFPGAQDLANMFLFYTDHHDKFVRSIEDTKSLVPSVTTVDAYLAANADKFKALVAPK